MQDILVVEEQSVFGGRRPRLLKQTKNNPSAQVHAKDPPAKPPILNAKDSLSGNSRLAIVLLSRWTIILFSSTASIASNFQKERVVRLFAAINAKIRFFLM